MDQKALQKSIGRLKILNFDKDSEMNAEKSDNSKSESESDEGSLLIVEKILKSRMRVGHKGVKEYLLKWKGFSIEEATWETEDNMDCEEMICDFDFEEKQKKLFKARKDLKLPANDYERKRLQNIQDMAAEKKKFMANLKTSTKTLKQALKRKSQAPRPLIKCEFCKRNYQIPQALEKHKRLVHKHKLKKIKSEFYFECNDKTCSEEFKTYDMIKEHIAQSHTFTCSACNESFKTKQQEKVHNCRPILCDCGKKIKTEQDLAAHVCHKCKYCDELFRNVSLLNAHEAKHLNPLSFINRKTGFECLRCKINFKLPSDLEKHKTLTHNIKPRKPKITHGWVEQEANEICAICDGEFADEKELKSHVNEIHRLSTGPKKPGRSAPKLKYVESDSEYVSIYQNDLRKKSTLKKLAKNPKYIESDSESEEESDKESDKEIVPVSKRATSKKKHMAKKSSPKKLTAQASKYVNSDSESEEESDKESDEKSDEESEKEEQEYVPKNGKRGAPVARSAVPAKKVAKKPLKQSSRPLLNLAAHMCPKEIKISIKKLRNPLQRTQQLSKYIKSDSESDKENEEEELEYVSNKGKRGPPAARSAIPAKKVAIKP